MTLLSELLFWQLGQSFLSLPLYPFPLLCHIACIPHAGHSSSAGSNTPVGGRENDALQGVQ